MEARGKVSAREYCLSMTQFLTPCRLFDAFGKILIMGLFVRALPIFPKSKVHRKCLRLDTLVAIVSWEQVIEAMIYKGSLDVEENGFRKTAPIRARRIAL